MNEIFKELKKVKIAFGLSKELIETVYLFKKSAKELTFCCHDKVTSSSSARSVDRPKVKLELSAVPLPPLSATELPPPPPAIVPLSTLLTVSDP